MSLRQRMFKSYNQTYRDVMQKRELNQVDLRAVRSYVQQLEEQRANLARAVDQSIQLSDLRSTTDGEILVAGAKTVPVDQSNEDIAKYIREVYESYSELINPFRSLCKLASYRKWCWEIGCSTCGCLDFRTGLFEISNGGHPDRMSWRNKDQIKVSVPQLVSHIRASLDLQRIVADAELKRIAKTCTFPDWLGYLGLALETLENVEKIDPIVSNAWAPQLRRMVRPNSEAYVGLISIERDENKNLTWQFLSLVERNILPEYSGEIPTNRTAI